MHEIREESLAGILPFLKTELAHGKPWRMTSAFIQLIEHEKVSNYFFNRHKLYRLVQLRAASGESLSITAVSV
jgi:hypothetical protein